MEIFKRMAAITKEFPVVGKDRNNPGLRYNYRGIDDALSALHPLMAKHGVFLQLCNLEPEFHDAGPTKAGANQVRCVLTGTVRFYAEDGSFVECGLAGEGIDSGDKAMMKAQANGLKYVVWYTFGVPTDEKKDSEAFEEPEATGKAPQRTKKAPAKSDGLEHTLAMSACKSPSELTALWSDRIRPELVQMPADSTVRAELVAAYKKRQAEFGA